MENSIKELFSRWSLAEKPPIIQLQNRDRTPVAAIYLDRLKARAEDIIVSETKTDERYYLYIDGIAVFFTYFKKEE